MNNFEEEEPYVSLYSGTLEKLYTNYEYIQRNLRNRLKVYQTEATSIIPINKVEQKVSPNLVGQYIDERQAFINGHLEVKYCMPLRLIHPDTILKLQRCAGQLVIFDLLRLYQYGSGLAALEQISPDLGYAEQLRREAINMLNSYCYQDNIAERGGGTSYRGEKVEAKRVDLKGEILRDEPQDGAISAATIYLGTQKGNTEYLKERQSDNLFSGDYYSGERNFVREYFY